jgi:type IV secretory pathway TrbF-like protein
MFKRPSVRYGVTPELDTPYRRARQSIDDRDGRLALNSRRVWTLALIESGVIAALAGALVWQGARGQVVPWVVEVDRFGESRVAAPALAEFKPTDLMVAARLQRFIEEVRSVSSDPIVVRNNWLRAYDFVSQDGARVLNAYAQANDPFARVGKEQVSVEVSSVLRASPTSFRLTWIERRYQDGALVATERWSAILTLVNHPTRNVEQLKKNPLGVFIDAIDWSKEMAQ